VIKAHLNLEKKAPATFAIHPGEILRSEFLQPLQMSVYALAKALHLPAPRINDIVLQKGGITPDTAVRLGHFFGISPEFWMNLQTAYELAVARKQVQRELRKIRPLELAGD
jgi:addiction module HigA family antidote